MKKFFSIILIISIIIVFSMVKKSTPSLNISIISDIHITDTNIKYNSNFEKALNYISKKNINNLIVVGDCVDSASEEYYTQLHEKASKYIPNIPIYFSIGNHELISPSNSSSSIQDNHNLFSKNFGLTSIYYHKFINNFLFIFLGNESTSNIRDAYLSESQLSWLNDLLKSYSSKNKPTFIFLHQPLKNTISGSYENQGWYGVLQNDELKNILYSYPNIIMFSGHSHWSTTSYNSIFQEGSSSPIFVNTGSVSYLSSDVNPHLNGSEGLTMEIYKNELILKSINFKKW